ncbi:hypothetical protein O1611_g5491 [Lasiodiplodia mahajangana]|uniref:Uncharacterized protein n=1 Tax=Lasiodiplodia mahajangana TaxID=1108764 RepID=A0ACC2JLC1_9PEZI|nr:hypothetical protein O1611_g5491 [Lasiodiplodia mahajangana]
MKGDLHGKTICITGGSGGLGKAIAKLLASRGANITIFARREELLEEARKEILASRVNQGQDVKAIALDLSDYEKVRDTLSGLPRIPDAIYCAAGGNHAENGFLVDVDHNQLDRCMKNNYYATLYPTKVLVDMWTADDKRNLKHDGKPNLRQVIMVSSGAAFLGLPGSIAYTRTDRSLEMLEAKCPSSEEIASLIVSGVDRGEFIICDKSWGISLLFTNMRKEITMEQFDPKSVNCLNGVKPLDGYRHSEPLDGGHNESLLSEGHPENSPRGQMPIAICGIGLRLPGGLSSPEQLWDFLLAKGDARCRVPASRYNVSAYYSTSGKPGTVASEYGYFLDESVDIAKLDTSSFSVSRSELQQTDPQQRLLLEVARECFEDAGVTGWRGKKIGCYVGNFGEDWAEMTSKETQHRGQYRLTGMSDYIVSNRISYEMDLQGPCMTVRTACSSGLVALNEACMAISRGSCESALVGGVNLILGPAMTIAMTEQGVLSPSGSCKSFSADADGYARGEAVTALYVKPLADALRDGNPVRAVIRSTAHNFDGKTSNISQPSTDAQEALIRQAYELAGITNFSETGMVECHGTGTVIGDPIETKAVAHDAGARTPSHSPEYRLYDSKSQHPVRIGEAQSPARSNSVAAVEKGER